MEMQGHLCFTRMSRLWTVLVPILLRLAIQQRPAAKKSGVRCSVVVSGFAFWE